MAPRRKGAYSDLYDAPFYKDWILYLWVLAVAVGFSSTIAAATVTDVYGQSHVTTDNAFWAEMMVALVVQTFLFGLVPGWIRQAVRRR